MDVNPEAYCRELEAYLCRKNDGHLVRIVGPAFDRVRGWAARGVPFKIACRGIDRYFDRYYARGPRRRPVRIEFCEADVLDVFDEWRRAVGVFGASDADEAALPADARSANAGGEGAEEHLARRRASLPAHLDRVVARLTALRGGDDRSLHAALDDAVRELDAVKAGAKALRGEARQALIERLRALDASLLHTARAACDGPTLQALFAEADAELAPFRDRMPQDAYSRSREACVDRLVRERSRLPTITFE